MYGISVPEESHQLRLPNDEMCDLTTTCCDENIDGNESSPPESEDRLGK